MRNKLILILIIVVIILTLLGIWIYSNNSYSKEIVRLEILGPDTLTIGEEVEYTVKVKNNGDVRLEEPRLVFEFPQYTITEDEKLRITIEDEFDGALYPGQEKQFKFKGRFFGTTGELKQTEAILSYRPKNLKARYVSKTSHSVAISEVPLTLEFDLPSSVGGGHELNFSLNYFSSIDYSLSDIEIRIDYPSGFSLKETSPVGLSDNEWKIGLLNKAEGGRINLTGSLNGSTGSTKTFTTDFGIWIDGEFVELKTIEKQVQIVEPSLYITQTINDSTDYVASVGDLLHYQITFRNIGDNPFQHLFLAIKLRGDLFDLDTIRSPLGENQEGANSIIWDWHGVSKLQFLDGGEEGTVEFWVELKDSSPEDQPELETEVVLSQTRQKFITKVNTDFELQQNVYIDDEPFGSQGPLPPKIGEDSYLTIIWKAINDFNDLENVKVKAVLPSNVSLTGKVQPQEMTFDSESREIVWSIDELDADDSTIIAFQVKLTPNSNQIGYYADLVRDIEITGKDLWTENDFSASIETLTTKGLSSSGIVK